VNSRRTLLHRAVRQPDGGTLKFKGETVCASLNDMSFEPCFDLNTIDDQSFRGSVLGMDFAYCDFAHLRSITAQPSDPLSLDPTH
jgi:hypothetical protein